MIVRYLNSFDRSFKKMARVDRQHGIAAIDQLLEFFETGHKPVGLGLKKVHKNFWEIRLDIRNRIIFELDGQFLNIVFIGNHNDIKRFLRGAN